MFFLIYFAIMINTFFSLFTINVFLCLTIQAQTEKTPYAVYTTKEARANEYKHLVDNSINKNLSLELTDSTEEDWQEAFDAMELINYRSAFVDSRISLAFNDIEKRSIGFQRAALELIYTLQIKDYTSVVHKLLLQTANSKLFAMCAEYLFLFDKRDSLNDELSDLIHEKISIAKEANNYAILYSLSGRIGDRRPGTVLPVLDPEPLFDPGYLKGNVVVYSIQRKNRNHPGIVIVKDMNGNFMKDEAGNIFNVPQLARSITNLPGYLTNGNTPQGIFRMDGFDVSKGSFIGPTENIQLTMPVETSIGHFLKDNKNTDTLWMPSVYRNLLPESLQDYQPLYESYQAGTAGRSEIIAHGTTVNPDYYKTQPYFPHTPTQGCLCTKEIWSTVDGKRTESDQQKLVDTIKKAGGANGYVIVMEINDLEKPVIVEEILHYLDKK